MFTDTTTRFSHSGGHSPAPLDGEPASVDDELVEGLLGGRLGGLPRGELDEGTLLPLDYGDGADLAKLVEMVPTREDQTHTHTQGQNVRNPSTIPWLAVPSGL